MTADSTEWRRREDILSESCNCLRWAVQSIYTYLGQAVLPLPGHHKHLANAVSENLRCVLAEGKEKKTQLIPRCLFLNGAGSSWEHPVHTCAQTGICLVLYSLDGHFSVRPYLCKLHLKKRNAPLADQFSFQYNHCKHPVSQCTAGTIIQTAWRSTWTSYSRRRAEWQS